MQIHSQKVRQFLLCVLYALLCLILIALKLRYDEDAALSSLQKQEEPVPAYDLNYSFGLSLGNTLPWKSSEALERELDDIASLDIGWIRMDFAWNDIQPHDSETYDWGRIDRVVNAAHKRGIRVLPILAYTPEWARDYSCYTEKCYPADPAAFASFAAEAVKRYESQGIHVWEIWNEPNITAFWQPAPSIAAYSSLLKAAHAAIRMNDPSATVISGSLAPAQTKGGNIAPLDFLAGMYAEGTKDSFEAVGFHPYSYPSLPARYNKGNAWSQMSATSPSLRSIMTANGDEGKLVWMTEFGAPTGGPSRLSDDFQLKTFEEAIEMRSQYTWAGPLFWYTYSDLGTSRSTNENFFGIKRYDGTAKPSYDMLLHDL